MTVIARNILVGLERSGLNQKDLAERTGVTKSCICQIISGKRAPSMKTLGKISEALGCTAAELLEDRSVPAAGKRRAG